MTKWLEDGIGSLTHMTRRTGTEQREMQTLNIQGNGEQVETIRTIKKGGKTSTKADPTQEDKTTKIKQETMKSNPKP